MLLIISKEKSLRSLSLNYLTCFEFHFYISHLYARTDRGVIIGSVILNRMHTKVIKTGGLVGFKGLIMQVLLVQHY